LQSGPRSPNQLLASLSAADYALVSPHLRPYELVRDQLLTSTGDKLERVYFPHSGVISLVVRLASGETIEAGMIGSQSAFGASSALDGAISINDATVQFAGDASTMAVADLRTAAERSIGFRTTLIRHEQVILAQAQQAGVCVAFHTADARLSGWLLRMRDFSASDTLPLTQELLAQMIGVRRNAVSLVANTLQRAGFIRYGRGRIEITNVEGLLESACECYGVVKSQYDRLLKSD
jgi:CRP-like cAMP-binding protein